MPNSSFSQEETARKAEIELIDREMSRRFLLPFTKRNFPSYLSSWHHELISEKLQAVERGEIKRLMIFMPPRHGKSELCSIQFPAQYLGKHPDHDIIAASYAAELAVSFGRKTRNLVGTDGYGLLYDTRLAEDSTSAARWNTNEGGGYSAVGVGGPITGKGAHLIIIDDPHKNRMEAESKIKRDGAWDWYRSTAYTRLTPNGAVIVIMTRWHDDDLAGRLLKDPEGDKWDVLSLPAIATADEPHRASGEALWPTQYPLDRLEKIRAVVGTYEWSSLYQQNPIDSATQEFKTSFFKERDAEEVSKLNVNRFLTIDTAVSKRTAADSTGFCDNAVDQENRWNLRAWRKKLSPLELIDSLFVLHGRNRYTKIGIEKGIYLLTLKPFLDEEMRKRNVFLPIVELDHQQTAKELRIRGLLPRYESGSIYHIKGECLDLEEELMRFPKASHDDVSDAAAYQLQVAEPPDAPANDEAIGLYSKTSYA